MADHQTRRRTWASNVTRSSLTGNQFIWRHRDYRPDLKVIDAANPLTDGSCHSEKIQNSITNLALRSFDQRSRRRSNQMNFDGLNSIPGRRLGKMRKQEFEIAISEPQVSEEEDEGYLEESSVFWGGFGSMNSFSDDQLDPFLQLAGSSSRHEKNLIHYYLSVTPSAIYGTHSKAHFDPVRDTTINGVATNHLFLQWVLLATQYSLLGQMAAKHPSVLARRYYAYYCMRQAVADPKMRYSDNTIVGLAVAGIAEARCGQIAVGMRHLAAVKRLMDARGGPVAMSGTTRFQDMIIIIAGFVGLGAGSGAFLSIDQLSGSLQHVVSSLLSLNRFNLSIRHPPKNVIESSKTTAPLEDSYWQRRHQVFRGIGILKYFVAPLTPEITLNERRCRIATLWVLNSILQDFHTENTGVIQFLDTLENNIRSGSIPGDPSGQITVKPITVIYLIAECALQSELNRSKANRKNIGIVERMFKAIDVIDVLQFAPMDTQQWVCELLSRWINADLRDNIWPYSDISGPLEAMASDINEAWISLQGIG